MYLIKKRLQTLISFQCALKCFRYKTTFESKNYQFLQNSKLPTHHFQKSLPSLPIPELSKSCERYIDAIEPLIGDKQQFEKTLKIVKQFEKGIGVDLHNELLSINKRNKHTSYISGPWFDMYLKSRLPIVLNYNPFMSWRDDPKPEYNIQCVRASNFIISALRFRRSLIENVLLPEIFHLDPKKSDNDAYKTLMRYTPTSFAFYVSALFKAYPLDMSQYGHLFSSTRIPRIGKDELVKFPESKHVAILKGGQFYIFNALDERGNIKDANYIYSCVKYISKLPKRMSSSSDSITFMTTEERDKWANFREKFIENYENAQNLRLIDSALFIVCLDDVEFEFDLMKHAHNNLHGNNGVNTPLNRWFDKSFSMIFTKDGHAAINFEHSWGDGVAVLRFCTEVHQDTNKNHFVKSNKIQIIDDDIKKEVKHLKFNLNDYDRNSIKEAEMKFRNLTENLNINYFMNDQMSRQYFKFKKVSLDSMFQLAFQMSFYKLHQFTPPTYESCSTSAFKHGRTETIRAATKETKETVEAFLTRNRQSDAELRRLLDNCSMKHFQLTKEAAMGQGFDRHFFVLKLLAEKRGAKLPDIFLDQTYSYVNYYTLSTSTLHGDCFSGGGFAPVVPDGYGLGYGSIDNILGIVCTTYSPHRNGKQFCDAFGESFNQIHQVLEKF